MDAAAARAVLEQDPRWPPRERHPGLPSALWAICERALDKVLSRRYPTPAALREDLQRFLDGVPLAARRSVVVPRASWGLPAAAAGSLARG